jgi:hypothetical protein
LNKGIIAGRSVAAFTLNNDFFDKNMFRTVELVFCLDEYGYAKMIMPLSPVIFGPGREYHMCD